MQKKNYTCIYLCILSMFCRMRSPLTGLYDIIRKIALLKELYCLYKQSFGGRQKVMMSLDMLLIELFGSWDILNKKCF